MSLVRFPQGHGPVTVSLLLPLITLASSLAFRPSPATTPADATMEEPMAVEAPAAPAASANVKTCASDAAQPCATKQDAPRHIVLVGAAAPRVAVTPAVAAVAMPAFAFDLAEAVTLPAALEFRAAGFSYSSDDDMPMLLSDPSNGESFGFWGSEYEASLRRLQRSEKSRFLWFRYEGREYVIRDAALLDRAQEIVEPQSKLGRAQGELGSVQGSLGSEQGRMGARQGAYGARLGELARLEARLQSKLHRRSLSAAEERELEAELDEVRADRERAQAEIESFGRGQAHLGARQAELGRRQAELGRQQAELARKVSREMKVLVREALRSDKAVRLGAEVY